MAVVVWGVGYKGWPMGSRRSRYLVPGPRAGSVLQVGGRPGPRRRRGARRPRGGGGLGGAVVVLVVVVAAVVGGVLVWRSAATGDGHGRAAVERFGMAWIRRDWALMWRALTPRARAAYSEARFVAAYRSADRAAGVRSVAITAVGADRGGRVAVVVRIATARFGTLRGTILVPVSETGSSVGVDWDPSLRLPGLRRGEAVHTRSGSQPQRAAILAADGTPLNATALGAAIAGQVAPQPTGLQRLYDRWLSGYASGQLLFGARVIARAPMVPSRPLPTTIRPRLMAQATTALGQQLGGVAVIRPRDGAVQALAGLAVSAPQPPGSTFKIITVSAALKDGIATPSTTYPVRTYATLSGGGASKRVRRGLRRLVDRGVHGVMQLGVRATRRQARSQAPGCDCARFRV